MVSALDIDRLVPIVLDRLAEKHTQDVISNQKVKTEADVNEETHIRTAAPAAIATDAEVEARLKRLEQLRDLYGVS